jgi:hypothetical protein
MVIFQIIMGFIMGISLMEIVNDYLVTTKIRTVLKRHDYRL